MAEVACTHVAGIAEWCTVLPSGVGPVWFWEIVVDKLAYASLSVYICSVDRDPQLGLIVSNRRCSSVTDTWSADLSSKSGSQLGCF